MCYRKGAGELWLPTEPPGKGAQAGSRETLHPVSGGPGCCTLKHIGRPRTVIVSDGMHPLSARRKRMVHNNRAAAARRCGTLAAPHVRTSQVTSASRRRSPRAAAWRRAAQSPAVLPGYCLTGFSTLLLVMDERCANRRGTGQTHVLVQDRVRLAAPG